MTPPPDPYALTPQLTGVTPPAKDEHGRFVAVLQTAPVWRRISAKLVDAIASGLISGLGSLWLPLWAASALGIAWFLSSDRLGSPGKWLFRIRAVMLDGTPATLLASLKRNLLLGLPSFGRALIVSGVTGAAGEWASIDRGIVAIFGAGVAITETILMWLRDDARRWGDRFADTRVVIR